MIKSPVPTKLFIQLSNEPFFLLIKRRLDTAYQDSKFLSLSLIFPVETKKKWNVYEKTRLMSTVHLLYVLFLRLSMSSEVCYRDRQTHTQTRTNRCCCSDDQTQTTDALSFDAAPRRALTAKAASVEEGGARSGESPLSRRDTASARRVAGNSEASVNVRVPEVCLCMYGDDASADDFLVEFPRKVLC